MNVSKSAIYNSPLITEKKGGVILVHKKHLVFAFLITIIFLSGIALHEAVHYLDCNFTADCKVLSVEANLGWDYLFGVKVSMSTQDRLDSFLFNSEIRATMA